jgi:small subunit ribosomal protein S17
MADEELNENETTEETVDETVEEPVAEMETPEEPAVEEPAAEPPVRDSGPVEGDSGEPGGSPAEAEVSPVKKKRKLRPRSERRQRKKPVRASEGRKPVSRQPKPEHERGARLERRGVVVSSAMDKTIVVRVETLKAHRRYKKIIRRSTKFHAHDERNEANVGDLVRIVETRPLSKTKRWRLAEVVEAAK